MNKRKLVVKVSSLEDSLSKFRDVWRKVERGEKIKVPIEILSFDNAADLMKTLSPKRLELLQELHKLEKVSIRQLAKHLHRDYSNVHQDVKALQHLGVVLESDEKKYYVPWDSIVTEIPLCTERNSHHRSHQHYSGSLGDAAVGH
jgi:predicted transcriptional regulator